MLSVHGRSHSHSHWQIHHARHSEPLHYQREVLRRCVSKGRVGEQIADMEMVRGSLAVAAMDGLVYAMGGGQPGVNLNSIEIFTPATNTWTPGPSMAASRFTTAGAALGSAIYMTGGFDGAQYLNSVEMLDPRTGTWHTVRLLPTRQFHGAIEFNRACWVFWKCP